MPLNAHYSVYFLCKTPVNLVKPGRFSTRGIEVGVKREKTAFLDCRIAKFTYQSGLHILDGFKTRNKI